MKPKTFNSGKKSKKFTTSTKFVGEESGDVSDSNHDELSSQDEEYNSDGVEEEDGETDDQFESEDEEESTLIQSEKCHEDKEHKKSLQKLKKSDPEFYQFLQENDRKLLQFDVSDSESETSEEEYGGIHIPPETLEGASDESDFEPEEGIETVCGPTNVVTLQMVEEWQEKLSVDKSVGAVAEVIKAFHAAVARIDSEDNDITLEYKVAGSSVFNAVIRLCVIHLQPALRKLLKISSEASQFQPRKCKKWKKIQTILRGYLSDSLKLLSGVSSADILSVLLKHNHQMILFWSVFSSLKKSFVKHLVKLWSTSEDDTVRVLAFLCLLRLNSSKSSTEDATTTRMYETTLKIMYIAYVQNTKFVSPSTLPAINFMRQSLSEIFQLNEIAAYPHVFMYIRQLAIHLRNAISLSKKENLQAVYNWQFVNSLHLWVKLLMATNDKSPLRPLLYPLVQVATGTIKLIPTAQYYPLRFHVVKMLCHLSQETGVFIPILPFLLEVLNFNFNKKHIKVSMKPMNFDCVLRLSKSQMQENAFKDSVIDSVYDLMFLYLASESHRIGFPDLAIPLCIEIKKFNKNCKVANYCRKLKQVLEKIEENVKYIDGLRRGFRGSVSDAGAVLEWETHVKTQGTPLSKYWDSWNKMNVQKKAKRETGTDKDDDLNIPVIRKPKRKGGEDSGGPVVLFPSSDESEAETTFEEKEPTPQKKKKRVKEKKEDKSTKKKMKMDIDEEDNLQADIVQDLDLSEFV